MEMREAGGVAPILLSSSGDNILRQDQPSDRLVIGTADGMFLLRRADSGEWTLAHRALQGCAVAAVTRLANGALIAGTHGQGVSRSDDQGQTWRWINNGLTVFDVWSVRAGMLNGRECLYAGTLPAHLFVSQDGGETWRDLPALRQVPGVEHWFFPPPPHQGHVKDIVVDGTRLLVGIEVGALLVSEDEGATFTALPVDPDPRDCDLHRILVHPARPGRIIIANGLAGTMASEDRGQTWQRGLNPPGIDYPDPLVMHPDDPELLFMAGAVGWPPHWYALGRARTKIARSRDGGKTWERLLGGLPDGQRAIFGGLTLEAFDGGYALYAADSDGQVFESRDGGDTWHIIAEVGPVSKGDFHKALAKGRPPMVSVDALKFGDKAAARIANAKV
jgi:photosystem II stability/assembly factor-like uncharacterized protein